MASNRDWGVAGQGSTFPPFAGPNEARIEVNQPLPADLIAYYVGQAITPVGGFVLFDTAGNYTYSILTLHGGSVHYSFGARNATGVAESYSIVPNVGLAGSVLAFGELTGLFFAEVFSGHWRFNNASQLLLRDTANAQFDTGTALFMLAGSSLSINAASTFFVDSVNVIGGWASFTPTWTSSANPQPALGNGSLIGKYRRFGKTVEIRIVLSAAGDGTTTFGTGNWAFGNFPVTTRNDGTIQLLPVLGIDNSAGNGYSGMGRIAANSTSVFRIHTSANTWGPAVPVAWAASDTVILQGTLEIA